MDTDVLPRFHLTEEGFTPQVPRSAAYGNLFVVSNDKWASSWMKREPPHPIPTLHSMVACPWTVPVADTKVCILIRVYCRVGWGLCWECWPAQLSLCPTLLLTLHFWFTGFDLSSTPYKLLYPSQLGVIFSGNPVQHQGCRVCCSASLTDLTIIILHKGTSVCDGPKLCSVALPRTEEWGFLRLTSTKEPTEVTFLIIKEPE